MGKLIRLVVLFVVLVVVLAIAKNFIAKAAIENGVGLATGLQLKMKSLDFSLIRTDFGINELELNNPKGFEDRTMLDLPEIYVNYKLSDIIKGNIHLEEIRINLQEFVVVKNKDGVLNLDSLTALQKKSEKAEKPVGKQKEGKAEMPPMQIDKMTLTIGKVVYKDYSGGGKPSVKEFKIGLNEEYSNIKDLNNVIRLIVLKVMMNTPLASLTGINVSELTGDLAGTLASTTKLASQATAKATSALMEQTGNAKELVGGAGENLSSATDKLEGTAKDLTGALKDTTSGLKDKLKNPFGN